jgi:hypothetical protein
MGVSSTRGEREQSDTLCHENVYLRAVDAKRFRFIVERNAPHTHLSLLRTKWLLYGGDSSLIAFAFGFSLFQFQESQFFSFCITILENWRNCEEKLACRSEFFV